MFPAAPFTAARTWTQPRSPVTGEGTGKLSHTCTREHYPAIKRTKFEPAELRWMNPEAVAQTEVRKKKENIIH